MATIATACQDQLGSLRVEGSPQSPASLWQRPSRESLWTLFALICGSLVLAGRTQANPIGGYLPSDSGGYSISTEAGNTFGVAVEFTPQQNLNLSSVTLWLSGYTGLDGSSLQLSLMQDSSSYGLPFSSPLTTIATATAAANNGSDAAFSFNLGGQLREYTSYWLFLYLEVPGGGVGANYGNYNCVWNQGGTATGNIVVDGSELYADGFNSSTFQNCSPAFVINSVPDAASSALLLILGLAGTWAVRRQFRCQ